MNKCVCHTNITNCTPTIIIGTRGNTAQDNETTTYLRGGGNFWDLSPPCTWTFYFSNGNIWLNGKKYKPKAAGNNIYFHIKKKNK